MKAIIEPGQLCGKITLPSSKSASHRLIIAAAISNGRSIIKGISPSKDIEATIGALRALGAVIKPDGDALIIDGITKPAENAVIDCIESGSTLRFMIPIAAAYGTNATFIGQGRLSQRPLDEITALLEASGVKCTRPHDASLPLTISGKLAPGNYQIGGTTSSQYITGLLFALAVLGSGKVSLTTKLESAAYVDMTVDTINKFGGKVSRSDDTFMVEKGCSPANITAEGDWSQAAFFLSAAALGGEIELECLDMDSIQGDKTCIELFGKMGCNIRTGSTVYAKKGELRPIDVDASQIPDMVPALAATLAFAKGTSRIYNAGRLRLKESDRLAAVADNLRKMGIRCDEQSDSLTIYGASPRCAELCGYNDHRIVMAFAVAALYTNGSCVISDAQAIDKSYPDFFKHFRLLGGKVDVI